jgi:CRISPR/Cas system endoribonuclease Cas6 (RAMP superfamily)
MIFNGSTKKYSSFPRGTTWKLVLYQNGVSVVEVKFLTPAMFQKDGNPTSEVDFSLFATALVRRIAALAHYAENLDGVPAVTPGEHVKINAVRVAHSTLQWRDTGRFSNNQQTAMDCGGVVGALRFEGELGFWIPLLQFGQFTHVGKGTAFGFGQYDMEVV